MLGVNQKVRKTPVSSRTTKLHSAISPSMKDQWSGKTLRQVLALSVARPRRSSAQPAAAPALLGLLPVAAAPWFVVAILLVSSDMVSLAPRNSARRVR